MELQLYKRERRGSTAPPLAGYNLPVAAAVLVQTEAVTPTATFGAGKWWWGRRFVNIFLLALGFMFSCAAYYAVTGVANNIIHDMRIRKYNFQENDGNIAFAILYGSLTLATFFVPGVVNFLGGKWSAIVGGITLLLYNASFLLNSRWYLFAGSAVCGFGTNLYWAAYGVILTANSDASTATRYTGFFWFLYNTSQIWGNIVVALTFPHADTVTDRVRYLTIGIFIGMSVIGCAIILFVRQVDAAPSSVTTVLEEAKSDDPLLQPTIINSRSVDNNWRSTLKVVASPLMLLNLSFFFFTGVSMTLHTSPLPTSVGFNKHFGDARKQLIGTTGYFMGVSDIISAFILTFVSNFVNRTVLWTVGVAAALTAMGLTTMNLPLDSTLVDSSRPTILYGNGSSVAICVLCFVLFGFADSANSIAMMSLLTDVFGHEQMLHPVVVGTDKQVDEKQNTEHGPTKQFVNYTAIAFAVMNGTQSLVCAVFFFFANNIWLNGYFYVYAPSGVVACVLFFVVDRNFRAGKYRNYFSNSHVQS